jgi:hypothetical protein
MVSPVRFDGIDSGSRHVVIDVSCLARKSETRERAEANASLFRHSARKALRALSAHMRGRDLYAPSLKYHASLRMQQHRLKYRHRQVANETGKLWRNGILTPKHVIRKDHWSLDDARIFTK